MGDRALERFLLDAYPGVERWRWQASLSMLTDLGYVERSPTDRLAFRLNPLQPLDLDAMEVGDDPFALRADAA